MNALHNAARSILSVGLVLLTATALAQDLASGRKYSTVERMTRDRLHAAHEDVLRIQESREPVDWGIGLYDYRAILHAHAEDAAHTGGTLPEMLQDAKREGVQVIMLSDHFRPPRDFIEDSWRGLHDGVLFIPGSETHGFLIHPSTSIMDEMELEPAPFIRAVTADSGLIFLSHVEERTDHPMDGLTGMEIYNRHADALDDRASMVMLLGVMVDADKAREMKDLLRLYPDELLAAQCDYPQVYLDKWDAETRTHRVTGIAANDCHHNQVFVTKMVDDETVLVGTIVDDDEDMRKISADQFPTIRELVKGHEPGDIVVRLDFDPYRRSFRNVSTHIFADSLSESSIREALRAGHAYVSHDWMCDPSGFVFAAVENDTDRLLGIMGDSIEFSDGMAIRAKFPVDCTIRIVRGGAYLTQSMIETRELELELPTPGVYRVEAWLTIDGESRPWIYSNPIYITPAAATSE